MLDLYNAMAVEEEESLHQGAGKSFSAKAQGHSKKSYYNAQHAGYSRVTPPYRAAPLLGHSPSLRTAHDTNFLNDADMVMSFVNLGKSLRYIQSKQHALDAISIELIYFW